MTITEVTQIGTLVLATVTASIALRTFKRNKKQELENQLFKIKLDAFSNIAFELDNFFIGLNRSLVKLHALSEEKPEPLSEQLKKLSLEVDESIYKCHSVIVKHSVYFSRKSLESLFKFTDNLLGDDIEAQSKGHDLIEWLNNYYSEQLDASNKAVDDLRDELQLEKLHHSLYKRSAY